jgi:HD-GYP domain-containing protein (c-di-GMP phosphodiesterase class II)
VTRRDALYGYLAAVGVGSSVIAAYCLYRVVETPRLHSVNMLVTSALFLVITWACTQRSAYLRDSSIVNLGSIGVIATLLVLPVENALILIGLGKTVSETLLVMRGERRSWRAPAVNAGGAVLAAMAGLIAFQLTPGHEHLWAANYQPILALPALLALGVAYHLTEVFVVSIAITLTSSESIQAIFVPLIRDMILPEISLIVVGIVFAVLWHFRPVLSAFIIVPMYVSLRSFESEARLRKETIEAVLKMAESIDYRDTGTYEHSQRLAEMTKELAAALGLTPEHIAEIVLASRVHDLGKIGISNDILLKPGALTPEERHIMQDHPSIGANILSSYSAFQGSIDIVRHHHERWDGRGYPNGLRGEDIPIGSRIITVVDSFDSMTADRPYRRGMTVDDAVSRLKDAMGTQFDPRVSATFIQLLIEQGTYIPVESSGPDLRIVTWDAG